MPEAANSGDSCDVIVVGAGNAALCAALSAQEQGARVVVLERAPEEESGGNSRFTAGAIRVAYRGVDDLRELMPDLTEAEIAQTDFGTYTEDQFFDDMFRVTRNRTDPVLCEILVRRSFETLKWLRGKGVRFQPIWGRQAFKVDGKFKFWGGLTVEAWGGGPGLVQAETEACRKRGVEIRYRSRAVKLLTDGFRVQGVQVRTPGRFYELRAPAVILASGGFQADAEWRTRYLGPGWELAKVRGTRFNTGDGIRMALEIGASPFGNWSGCHAVQWDFNAPEFGDLAVGDAFQKHSYPWGVLINANGRRFLDEGADFRNYTYAKYGRVVLEQPGNFAWQIFDRKVLHLLRDEYRIKQVTKVRADTLEELAQKLEGVDAQAFLEEIRRYNAAVRTDIPFNPNVKDGRRTEGLEINKSNWANTIDEPPFEAYQVGCGITFTFGGLRIDPETRVLDQDQEPIPGLYACGELVGGIFYFNYPGGSGLINGAVFGKIAGATAVADLRRNA
ncbi:FAD-dependent tricarballylate dehydrogenase TcuA [Caldovatus aquaticus]|uniref:FAD-dependent tricarballylate dehydrogenase TcuA n=1 Tax=Caldovatus aquaticus TaxID=2865671 RepID=A0ABS7F0A4_9PROT|nr:FAD-dependent tricarballylate dehydrogenase TcuA [Caldovatus aquaticus]MBW8269036.1 FAD-dependent tricarballylate dehydrogenase TcuA [Caldovatus aquaticus]